MTGPDHHAALAATHALPGIPVDADGPVFREPWEAHAFAMAVTLHARGLFTWPEWAAALAEEIARAQAEGDSDCGDTYYRHWLATLERLVADKGVTTSANLARYRDAWDHAADRTPHGKPIELSPEDFAG
ncbi:MULTISPECIES: nitrile hydratase accessory protein [Bradyrhizobium]|uniref:nitrile hydratase accessory protein n=1 Tax=Bradyrhizobium TaxID=374 RepID=UPI001553464B|nr:MULTISPECIES: nitrile hydratase accessory protein [Bradyrhizobium]NPU12811.1 nitrile hydratase accessory protein [Bradyrhizobium aeschynomenes]